MIFREIKITGQDTLKVNIPESWEDVTFKQLANIIDEKDALVRVSVLTGIPVELFSKYPELADFYVWLETKLDWSSEWKDGGSDSEVFNLDDGTFYFPKDVGVLSIGLYKDIQSEAQKNKEKLHSIYPLICASYYQIIKDGEYDYIKAQNYVSMFEEQPCMKVYNAAGFFLTNVTALRNGTKKGRKSLVIQTIKKWLGSIGFQKYSGLKLSRPN
jgi:hypothetical protein